MVEIMSETNEVKNKPKYYVPVDRVISSRVQKRINSMTDEERNKVVYLGGINDEVTTEEKIMHDFLEFVKEEEENYAKSPLAREWKYEKKQMTKEERIYDCSVWWINDRMVSSGFWHSSIAFPLLREIASDYNPSYLHPRSPIEVYNKKYRDAQKKAKAKGKTGKALEGKKVMQDYEKARKPETSLSDSWIEHFDGISDKWLNKWCNFSVNWGWVLPCLFLCLFVQKGLSSAIGLLTFMGIGEWYSWKAQEYCSVIIPWYQRAGLLIERRLLRK